MNNISFYEGYAGIGGFHIGLKRSGGYECVGMFEKNPKPYSCYTTNFGENPNYLNEDIKNIDFTKVPKAKLVVMGFPCQDNSIANPTRKGIEGKNGQLWHQNERMFQEMNPQFLLLENVDNLKNMGPKEPVKLPGRDFGMILHSLYHSGYNIEYRIICSSDYGGATIRKRIFIFGWKKDKYTDMLVNNFNPTTILTKTGMFAKQFPVKNRLWNDQKYCDFEDFTKEEIEKSFSFNFGNSGVMIDGMVFTGSTKPITTPPITVDQITDDNVPPTYELTKEQRDSRTERLYNKGQFHLYCHPLNEPGKTLLTRCGQPSAQNTMIIYKNHVLRTLTPWECARMHHIPEEHINCLSDSDAYHALGNSLDTMIVTKIGNEMKNIINL